MCIFSLTIQIPYYLIRQRCIQRILYTHKARAQSPTQALPAPRVTSELRTHPIGDTDSSLLLIDSGCSQSITNDLADFIDTPCPTSILIEEYTGSTMATKIGTVHWSIEDDTGQVHHITLPNTYYSPAGKVKLL